MDPDPWTSPLIVVRRSADGRTRNALSRDAARGLLLHLRAGVWADRAGFDALSREGRHIVRMRALAAVSDRPPVFSHFSAAAVLGLPVLEHRLARVHVLVDPASNRARTGVAAHVVPVGDAELREFRGLLLTAPGRTVVDIAGAAPFEEGVMAADAALRAGPSRDDLRSWLAFVAPRRTMRRMEEVIEFAHPGAESAAESLSRTSLLLLGVEPPELQHRVVLLDGSIVFLDMLFRSVGVGGEIDGATKLLDPAVSPDARESLRREKRREDAVRLLLRGLARWGWAESRTPSRLAPVLAAVGVLPENPRTTLADYAAEARNASPRLRMTLMYG